jgi:site-specific DNA recombinase
LKTGVKVVVYAVGYCRVSTDEQAHSGASLAMQATKILGYLDLHELTAVGMETDEGLSASSLRRPALARALAMLDDGRADALVVYKLDRLTRSLKDWSHLIERYFGNAGRCSLMSVSESIDTRTAGGRLVLNLLMTVAQWEREAIMERTQATADHLRSEGRRISGPVPYGKALVDDGRRSKSGRPVGLADDPAEQAVLAEIRTMHANGASGSAIAADLERRGVPTRTGCPWGRSTIRGLVDG